jgi:hypothetical protein
VNAEVAAHIQEQHEGKFACMACSERILSQSQFSHAPLQCAVRAAQAVLLDVGHRAICRPYSLTLFHHFKSLALIVL